LAIFLTYVLLPWHSRLRRPACRRRSYRRARRVRGDGAARHRPDRLLERQRTPQRAAALQHRLNEISRSLLDAIRTKAPGVPLPHDASGLSDELNTA